MVVVISREQWGARAPRDSGRAAQFREGIAFHYSASSAPARHEQCAAAVRGFQRYHMDTRGWRDIGYGHVFCNHGVVFEGRGWWTQLSAHAPHNSTWRAACWIGGPDDTPTDEAIEAARWLVAGHRERGGSDAISGHRLLLPGHTSCPGDAWVSLIESGRLSPRLSQEDDMPLTDDDVRRIAERVWRHPIPWPDPASETQSWVADILRHAARHADAAAQPGEIQQLLASVTATVDPAAIAQALIDAAPDHARAVADELAARLQRIG